MFDARHCRRDRADHRTTRRRQPLDLTGPGIQKGTPLPAPAGRCGAERQRHRPNGLPSGHPSGSCTAARLRAEPTSAAHPRRRSNHPASAARPVERTCAHRWSGLQRWHDQLRHPSTAASLCLQRGADARRHCSRLHGRAPRGRDRYRTALRHCWPGEILGRHCSSQEIPSSFRNLDCLIPAPQCAPVAPRAQDAQSGVRSRPRAYHQNTIPAMRTTRSHACQLG